MIKVLADGTLALHFAGHGIKNSDYKGFNLKGEGDILIFEQEDGTPHYLSEFKLKSMLQESKSDIQFVLISSCHSENIGRVFYNAGVKHVICIRQEDQIMDEASIKFSSMFYEILFKYNKTICEAFALAK